MNNLPAEGVCVNAEGSPLLPLLQNATNSIDIEIYTMKDPTVRTLLRSAISRGVTIRVVKEPKPVGESCNVFATTQSSTADCADQQSLVSEIRAAGGTYEPFNKANLCGSTNGKTTNCFEHGKIAITDGIALISTGNFDATNLCISSEKSSTCDRDYTLITYDATVVNTLEALFSADLHGASYDVNSLIPASLSGILTVSPDSLTPIDAFIASAQTSIDIEAQYLEAPEMNSALKEAAKRGVKISITTASACAFGKPTASKANKITQIYSEFDSAGIESKMYNASNKINGKPGYMHAKVMVVDGQSLWLGSENGSNTSLSANREYGIIVTNAADVQTVLSTLTADHNSTDTETWSESLNCSKDRK